MLHFNPFKIKERRAELGLTQFELAKLALSTRSYLARIEAGFHEPSAALLGRIASVLKVPVDYFFFSIDEVQDNEVQDNEVQDELDR